MEFGVVMVRSGEYKSTVDQSSFSCASIASSSWKGAVAFATVTLATPRGGAYNYPNSNLATRHHKMKKFKKN